MNLRRLKKRIDETGWESLDDAQDALDKIKSNWLNEDELVLLHLMTLDVRKTDREMAEVLGVSTKTIQRRRNKLFAMIDGLSWWIKKEDDIKELVTHEYSLFHAYVLEDVIERRPLYRIASKYSTEPNFIKRVMNQNRDLLKDTRFESFLKVLRMHFHVEES